MRDKRTGPATVLVLLVAVVLTHGWTLRFPYYVDDFPQLFEAQELGTRGVLMGATRDARGVPGVSSYFRPALHFSFWLDTRLYGFERWGFHLTSLALHLATSLLLLALGRRLGAPRLAFAWAMVFAVHPSKVEAVYWIAARGDLLVAFFGVLAAWCLVVHRAGGRRVAAAGCVLATVGAMTSKESGMAVPAMLVALDVLVLRTMGEGRRRWLLDVALLAAAAVTWLVRREVVGIEGVHYVGLEMELGRESVERAIRRYPVAIETFFLGKAQPAWALVACGSCAVFGLAATPWRRLRPGAIAAGAAILALAMPPALVLLEAEWVGISRHAYVPALVLCLAAAVPLVSIASSGRRRLVGVGYGISLAALLGAVAGDAYENAGLDDAAFRGQLAAAHPGGDVAVGVVDMPLWIGFGLPLSLRPPFSAEDDHAVAVDPRDEATLEALARDARPMLLLRWDAGAGELDTVTPGVVPPRDHARRLDVSPPVPAASVELGSEVWPRDVAVIDLALADEPPAGGVAVMISDEDGRTYEISLPPRASARVIVEHDVAWYHLGRLARAEVAGGIARIARVSSLAGVPRLRVLSPAPGARHSYAADGDLVFTVRDPDEHAAYRLSYTEPVPWSRTIARAACGVDGDVVRISTTAPAIETEDQPAAGAMTGPEIMKTLNLTSLSLRVVIEGLSADLAVQARSRPLAVTVVP